MFHRSRKHIYLFTVLFMTLLISIAACQVLPSVAGGQSPTQVSTDDPSKQVTSQVTDTPVPLSTGQKEPAYSDAPASGICAESQDDPVLITILPGLMPDPRCMKVSANQRLQFKNETGVTVQLQLGQFDITLPAGDTQVLDAPVSDYLEPGVHHATLSDGSVPEIWLSD